MHTFLSRSTGVWWMEFKEWVSPLCLSAPSQARGSTNSCKVWRPQLRCGHVQLRDVLFVDWHNEIDLESQSSFAEK